jgi:HTH-type transcriptional regulator, competence development regulator
MACARYMEERIDHEKYTEFIWRDPKGEFADTLRMANNIFSKDSDTLNEDERITLRTIMKCIFKKT